MIKLMILVKCSLSYGEHTPPPPRWRIRKCFPWINLIVEAHRDRRFFWSSSFIGFFLTSMDILNEPMIFYIVRRHTCGCSCCHHHRWWWWSRKAEATISANHHQRRMFFYSVKNCRPVVEDIGPATLFGASCLTGTRNMCGIISRCRRRRRQ